MPIRSQRPLWVLFACRAKPREWGQERTLLLCRKHEVASQKEHAQGHCRPHRFIVLDQPLLVSTAPSLHSLALPQPTPPRRWGLPCGSPTSAQRTHRALAPSCASSQNHFLPGVTLVLLVTSCPTSKHPRAGAWSRRCPLKHWVRLMGRVQLNFVEWPLGKGRGRLGDLFTSS